MKKLFLLDAVMYLFRSYYAIRKMTNKKGTSTNALYGFIRSVQKVIADFSPDHLIAVFDGPNNKEARTAIYKEYKAHREGMPEDLVPQLDLAIEYCKDAGIPCIVQPGVEADDMIGSMAKWAESQGSTVYICSSDKDLCQLVSDKVFLLSTHKDNLLIDREKVEEIHGVKPEQIVDYLGIMGDKSDNIPGIPGFGPKTASTLLKEHGTLENLIAHLDDLKNQSQATKIRDHIDDARMSRQLAQIILDVPFPKDSNFFALKAPNQEKLKTLYQEMNFSTLLKELSPETREEKSDENVDYHIVDSEKELLALIEELKKSPELCIDTETTSLHPMAARLVGVGIANQSKKAWYIPTNGMLGLENALKHLKPLLENQAIAYFGHNLKYDIHVLKNHGIKISNIGFDTILASYLLHPENNRHGLDTLALEKFGKVKTPIKELIGSGKKEKTMDEVPIEQVGPYCCEDVDYTYRLKELFSKELKEQNLDKIFCEIELPLIPVLADMERYGMYVDKEKLLEMSKALSHSIGLVEKEIYKLAGTEFNIKSPKQLAEVLFDQLMIPPPKGKRSTRAEVLEELSKNTPIASKIIEFRTLEKLRSTYVDALPTQVCKETHRIHCSFMQSVTATGRLSCQNPNLQNIPIRTEAGRKIRSAFQPEKKGWSYLSADYSQIELRLLAHLSQEKELIDAFKHNKDIHASTASAVFGVPLEAVTREMRSQAKAVNFGIIYGQQAFGLSQILGMDVKIAADFIRAYFETYPGVKGFLEECKEKARKSGAAITMFGRKRPIPEINSSNGMIRSAAERLAVNTPLQGSQADIIKKAMIQIDHAIKKQNLGHMILQIHDELLFELPDEHLKALEKTVTDIMENIVNLEVPLTVNIAVGKNWGEC